MIIVFPMLVSRAVSENSIPGIAKTLENYIIINKQDLIINSANAANKKQGGVVGRLIKAGGSLLLGEGEIFDEAGTPPGSGPGTKGKGSPTSSTKTAATSTSVDDEDEERMKELKRRKAEWEEETRKAKKASISAKASDAKSISLEPTYLNIERQDKYGNKTTTFLGIKVVPIRVKSDVKLSHLILYDSKMSSLVFLSVSIGRKITRTFYHMIDKWVRRLSFGLAGGTTPSGDPRRDIIMGRTGMGKGSESFIVLSKQEDIDEFFLDNIGRLNRLFRMGWGNFIVADDIGRTAYFCMKKFKGMCNAIPYAMMYQYLGQSKAYETMEDAKKANSSIFKISPKRFSKVIGEWVVEHKLDKYSHLSEDKDNE
jgi:hypothetical protein